MSRFDQLATQWEQNPARAAVTAGIADAMRAMVPFEATWRLLDYGAGTGLLTLALLSEVAEAVAVDTSAGMLAVLRGKLADAGLTQVAVVQANLEAEPWSGPPVDVAVSAMTLHHLRDVPAVLRRLAEATRPGGWLAVADLDREDGSFHGPEVDDVFHHGFDREQLAGWLVEAGWADVRLADAYRLTKPDAQGAPREYGIFVAAGRKA
jgi:ubiquinone/menaquinone biosynthesis C-methylase UbiE